ncbi:toll-like receptor 4 [Mytilus galloprovincialis]|uniref:toll-like receptor 4 n=1 Tax=Mytilus galloprovincialis TaxID=29158 RepID=UPI003F7B6D18
MEMYWIGILLFVCIDSKCIIKHENHGYKEALCMNQGLTSVPADLPQDITTLDLSYNSISNITGGEFSMYIYLQDLIINRNVLEYLDSSAFSGLRLLRRLSMSRNNLQLDTSYPLGVFKPLSNLLELDISRNIKYDSKSNISYTIPVNELVNIEELSIDLVAQPHFGNHFRDMKNLQKLRFEFCHVRYLHNHSFSDMPENITELHMSACYRFVVTETNVLGPFSNLKTLNLTNSNIHLTRGLNILYPLQNKNMDNILFRGITNNVAELDLGAVTLTTDDMKYISTICVKTLDLSNNDIVSIKNQSLLSFKFPECFENILLSGNRFAMNNFAINFFIFFGKMRNLKLFDYSYMPIQFNNPVYLNVYTKGNNQSLIEEREDGGGVNIIPVIIPPSQIEYFRITHIMGVNGIKKIILFKSRLRHFEISYVDTYIFPEISIVGNNHIQYLDISGINSVITIGKFPVLKHLRSLIMKESKMYDVLRTNKTILKWFPNIRTLDISYNFIWNIPSDGLGELRLLNHLNLSHNMLESVPEVLLSFKSITELDVSYNLLTTLKRSIRNWIDKQYQKHGQFRLYLNKNSFICSCDTKDFILWISKNKAILDQNGNYTCLVPKDNGRTNYTENIVNSYQEYFVECDDKIWLKIGSSLLASLIFIIICATLCYNLRRRIIFWFYRTLRRMQEEAINVNFEYDVYVSYSDDGTQFVKELTGTMENCGLKICCEDRDFEAGVPIADEKARSIHLSRHIIFLVTPSIVQNEWSRFEIERAKFEKLSKELQKIIVITQGISLDEIPVEFATIWNKVNLIVWPNEEDEIAVAWKKLLLWLF